MHFLFALFGFKFFFGTRLGAILFTVLGAAFVFGALKVTGEPTASIMAMSIATMFAAKRAFSLRR